MNRWLDSLSEDWVSQPRPSPPASLPNGSHLTSDDSSTFNTSRSRIPRFKPRSDSTSALKSSSTSKIASRAEVNNDSEILGERTSSTLNVRPRQSLENTTKLAGKLPVSISTTRNPTAVSDSSLQSVEYHTIQHKLPSPAVKRGGQRHETPEWKRRALKGEVGFGEQRDLFSPMGLENIFKPATARLRPQKKARGLRLVKEEEFPSSPPPYSLKKESQKPSLIPDMKHLGQGALEDLEEDKEEQKKSSKDDWVRSDRSESEQDIAIQETERVSGQDSRFPSRFPGDWKTGDKRGPSQTYDDRYEDQSPAHINRAGSQDGAPSSTSLVDHVERSRTISGQEESRNEKISPVFVSRHNT
ncbi:MAG: leucine rich repeat, partial [Pleopsidium flavum]